MDTIQPNKKLTQTDTKSNVVEDADVGVQKTHGLERLLIRAGFCFYRVFIVPVLRIFGFCGCRFHPSCSHYAEALLIEEVSLKNIAKSIARIIRCNPWVTRRLTFDPPTPAYVFETNKL